MIRRLAIVVLLAGCASMEMPGVHSQELQSATEAIRRRDAELQDLSLQSAPPDCARVTQLRDNICALAAKICQIAAEQPAGSNAAIDANRDCTDGKTRCKRAGERAQALGCAPK